MARRVAERFRRLDRLDQVLLCTIGLWILIGLPGNYFRVHRPIVSMLVFFFVLWLAVVVWLLGCIVYSMSLRRRTPGQYGFSAGRWGLISLVVVAAINAYLMVTGRLALSDWSPDLIWPSFGAFMEEVAFRAILINGLDAFMDGIEGKGFWAILGSSVLFSVRI